MEMDATFFNNHNVQDMHKELDCVRRTNSSFRIQCWIASSNERLLKHYNNIKYISDLVNTILTLEHKPDLIIKHYGDMIRYKQVLHDLLKHSEHMLATLFERWDILVEASIINKHVKNMEHVMALQLQTEQQIRICIE